MRDRNKQQKTRCACGHIGAAHVDGGHGLCIYSRHRPGSPAGAVQCECQGFSGSSSASTRRGTLCACPKFTAVPGREGNVEQCFVRIERWRLKVLRYRNGNLSCWLMGNRGLSQYRRGSGVELPIPTPTTTSLVKLLGAATTFLAKLEIQQQGRAGGKN